MSSTFDPKRWCLLYFSIPDTGALPISPEEFFESGKGVVLNLQAQEAGDVHAWHIHTPQALYEALDAALNHPIYTGAGKMFTVHKIGLFERLQNWKRLAKANRNELPDSRAAWAIPTTDLVEEFHRPAILTFQQRKEFSAAQVNFWIGGDTSIHTTLWRLCHLL